MSEISNLQELRIKYLNGNRGTKDQILTSLCLVHGYHRKSAIRVLYGELRRLEAQRPRKRRKPGVRSRYQDPGFKAALKAIWKETDYMCSKNLKRAMPIWLPAYEAVDSHYTTYPQGEPRLSSTLTGSARLSLWISLLLYLPT